MNMSKHAIRTSKEIEETTVKAVQLTNEILKPFTEMSGDEISSLNDWEYDFISQIVDAWEKKFAGFGYFQKNERYRDGKHYLSFKQYEIVVKLIYKCHWHIENLLDDLAVIKQAQIDRGSACKSPYDIKDNAIVADDYYL